MWRLIWLWLTIVSIAARVFASPSAGSNYEATEKLGSYRSSLLQRDDTAPEDPVVLHYKEIEAGRSVNNGTKLRILPVGDSITVGALSELNGGDGNGFRDQLQKDLSGNEVTFVGTEISGKMSGGHYAAWRGKSIHFISEHVEPSLPERPNLILLTAGTNDMSDIPKYSPEGNDPAGAANRLGQLIDKLVKACPDATILVAMILDTCISPTSAARTKVYQKLIPDVVKTRKEDGKHVLAADFTIFPIKELADCIHPTHAGYKLMGDYWYDFIQQIPSEWITEPVEPGTEPDSDGSGQLIWTLGAIVVFVAAVYLFYRLCHICLGPAGDQSPSNGAKALFGWVGGLKDRLATVWPFSRLRSSAYSRVGDEES